MTTNRVGFGDGTIRTTSRLLADAKGELRRLGQELQGEINGMQGKWGGAGARAFGVLNQAWDDKHRAIVSTLERFEANLQETEVSLSSSDETAAASVGTIRSQMEGVRRV